MSKLNIEKFKDRFHPTWWPKVAPFISSPECYEIYQVLKSKGQKILPYSSDLWNAFKYCDYNKLSCIIVGQSPYHTIKEDVPFADGLCFSVGKVREESPSLKVLYDAIESDLGKRGTMYRNPDLMFLAHQEILLLNLSLTIEKGNKDSFNEHEILWRPFIQFLFKNVLDVHVGIPILIFGKPAEEQIVPLLDEWHLYQCIKHPAFYSRAGKPMEHNNCFSWANNILKRNNKTEIYWDFNDWVSFGLPF